MSNEGQKKKYARVRVIKRIDGKDMPIQIKHGYGVAMGAKDNLVYFVRLFKEVNNKGETVWVKNIHTIADDESLRIDIPQEYVEEKFKEMKFFR